MQYQDFRPAGADGGDDHEGAAGLCERAAAGGGPAVPLPGRPVDAQGGRRRGHVHTTGLFATGYTFLQDETGN